MRLLTVGNMYPPQALGGYEAVWASAVEHLRDRGHDVAVLTTDTRVREQTEPDPAHVHRTLRWHWRDHVFAPATLRSAASVQRHNKAILREHLADAPDAVLWWAMGGMSLGVLGQAAAAGVSSGAVVHDAWPVYGPRVDPWIARRSPGRFTPEVVGAWSFNSAWLRDGVIERVPGVAAGKCRVDAPGIDAVSFAAPLAGEWGWRLACVGRVEATKGLAVAIEALATLPEQATLTIAGGGDEAHRAELEALADGLGLSERVTFTGALPDVRDVYAAADAVLFPVTWEEPFGLVPLEAMAAGRPVVATGTGGSAEYLRDGVNCLLSAAGDAGALADAAARLAADGALRAMLVAGGAATARAYPVSAFNEAMGGIRAAGRGHLSAGRGLGAPECGAPWRDLPAAGQG